MFTSLLLCVTVIAIALFLIALLLQSYFRFYSSDNQCPVESRYVYSSHGTPKAGEGDDGGAENLDVIDSDTDDDTPFPL